MKPEGYWGCAMQASDAGSVKIGVRYCGGCNPRYDRVAVVKKIQSLFPDFTFENAQAGQRYLAVIVVSGCTTACTQLDDLVIPEGRLLRVGEFKDFVPVKQAILELMERKDEPAMDLYDILEVLPQRPPMLFVDAVESLQPGKEVKALFHVRKDLPEFAGHFPGNPVFPGVHTLEAMAQAADLMLLSQEKYKGRIPVFGGVKEARFRIPILPGDHLKIQAVLLDEREDFGWCHCKCQVLKDDDIAADAEITLIMKDAVQE